MVVTVIGLGFVGLTTALGFASKGHTVYGVELNSERKELIASGRLPFYEPGMQEALEGVLNTRFFPVSSQTEVREASDCVFYCVGTPFSPDGSADLHALFSALDETVSAMDRSFAPVLVIKSTIPPGTLSRRIRGFLCDKGLTENTDFYLANNPEFLREGHSWQDFTEPDRIVLGTDSDRAFETLQTLYEGFHATIHRVTPTTAEFIKYLSNSLLATLISFSNEMAETAFEIGDIQIPEAFHILHEDHRWADGSMSSYVYPGCGYGGYCLPKDTAAMLYTGQAAGCEMPILSSVISTNLNRAERFADRITEGLGKEAAIGILGLAFKPGTDDVRDSPAFRVCTCLKSRGYHNIHAYDPMAGSAFVRAYPELELTLEASAEKLQAACDRLFLATAWPEFKPFIHAADLIDGRYSLG